MKLSRPAFITCAAAIAAVYVVLTLVFAPISYGEVQVRISESLTILPFFTPAAVPGLFIGCLIANITGGAIIWDIIFGSVATLIGAIGTYKLRNNRWLAPIPPIISIIYSSFCAFYSQFRLASGFYMEKFDVTDKAVKK